MLTRAQSREIDRIAIERFGIPGIVLMENAARSAVELMLNWLREKNRAAKSFDILCGGGNNGGDGYAIARHLHNRGSDVRIHSAVPLNSLKGDTLINQQVASKIPLPIIEIRDASEINLGADCIIDALLGTGFSGELRPQLASIIRACNETRGKAVVAIDLPSGLDCDTGIPADPTIRADLTVTFVGRKKGFDEPEAQPYLGDVVIGDIGAPPIVIEGVLH